MLRRNIKRFIRYPELSVFTVGVPIVFLLFFVYVFGGALGAGIAPGGDHSRLPRVRGARRAAVHHRRRSWDGSSIGVSQDMTEGIVARFRTMSISRGAVLAGHVWGSILQGLLALVLVMGVALLHRDSARPPSLTDWLLLIGVLVLILFALHLARGRARDGGEVGRDGEQPADDLPAAAVPRRRASCPTDTMPEWLQVFAEWQPFTPFIETVRGLLLGTPIG